MRIFDRYIILLSLVFMLTTVVLSALGETRLDLYFSAWLVEYLAVTFLYIYFNPRARKMLDTIGYVLFAGFMVMVAMKVAQILFGIKSL